LKEQVKFDGYEERIGWNVDWQEGLIKVDARGRHPHLREAQKLPTFSGKRNMQKV
jgi:hypothetical protein